jgi:hypothetical protein
MRHQYLGDGFRFISLLRIVLSDTLSLDPVCLCIRFFVRLKIKFIVVIVGLSFRSTAEECLASRAGSREGTVFGSIGLDVGVPTGDVRVFCCIRARGDRFEDMNISLGGGVSSKGLAF